MNLILVVIDTLRYDYVGFHGGRAETPNIDRLASDAWVFDRAFCSSFPTIPHRTDVMTGAHGGPFNPWMPLRFDVPTLPSHLAQAGFCTQLIHDTPHLVNGGHNFDWPFNAWTFVRGAEVDRPWITDKVAELPSNWAPDPVFDFAGDPEMKSVRDHVIVSYTRANRGRGKHEDWNCARLFLTAAEFLRDNAERENFFLWLDCFDPHEPWDSPPEFVLMYDKTPGFDGRIDPRAFVAANHPDLPDEAVPRIAALYAAKVSWVDHWFGVLLDALDETGLADNTAVLLTSDHGTNDGVSVGRRFGKSHPVREPEGHVPFIVRAPGAGKGRSDIVVQPHDVFATLCRLAGVTPPEGIDSNDVVALAGSGGKGPREVAVAGASAHGWRADPEACIFTVFGEEHYLEFAPKPEVCRLRRYGQLEDVASEDPGVVQALREAGVREVARCGSHPLLMKWIEGEGEGRFPGELCQWRGPRGFRTYWNNAYNKW